MIRFERNGYRKMANTNKKDKLNDIIGFDFGGPAPKNKAPKKKPAQKDNDDKVIKEIEIEDDIALDEDLENEEDFDDIYEFDPESVVSTKKSLSVIGGISGGALILFIALFFILKATSILGTNVSTEDFVERYNATQPNLNSPPQGYGDLMIGSDFIKRGEVTQLKLYNGITLQISTKNNGELLWAEAVCSNSHLIFDIFDIDESNASEGNLALNSIGEAGASYGMNFAGVCGRLVRGIDPSIEKKAENVGQSADQYAFGISTTILTHAQHFAYKDAGYTENGIYTYTDSYTSDNISYTIRYYENGGISFKAEPNTAEKSTYGAYKN